MSIPERAGWYEDPEDQSRLRYFDGVIWSERTVPRQTRSTEPVAPADPVPRQGGPATDVFGRPVAGHGTQQGHPHRSWPGQQPGSPGQQPGPPGQQQAGWPQQQARAQQPAPEPTTEDGQPLARYGSRVGAYIIDLLIVGLLNLVLTGWAWYLWMADYWSYVWDAAMTGDQAAVNELRPEQLLGFFEWRYFFIAMGLSLLLQAAYHVGFLATRNATPGKMVLGLTVRRVERPGPLGAGTAFMRMLLPLAVGVFSMVPLLSYLLWFVSLADLLWPIKDPRRQALHDKIAGTQVVQGKQPRATVSQEA